ncbi:MAG: hypothetical protein EOP34_11140, partial [Rickettsiales bacterium]
MLYALTCTIEYLIVNELSISSSTEQYLIPMGTESDPMAANSLAGKGHVFLSSTGNPNVNTNPTEGQVPVQNATGGEGSKPSIFANPDYIRPVTPERGPVPIDGQGDNPTMFTTAKQGDQLTT